MSYEKQVWSKYDALKPEEENIENGAVVTDSRMNHMEEGIESNDNNFTAHSVDKNNPHKVTATQVGLGNVQNFGLATENEAKQGASNAKYMTPSLTQAVLSANINSVAYAKSADGTDGFTTVYPNLNLLNFKSGLKIGQFLAWADGLTIGPNPARAVFDYVSVIPGTTYTINSNWDKTERIAIYAYDSNDRKNATFIYDGSSAKWASPSTIGLVITQKTTLSIPDGMNFIRVVFLAKDTSATLTLQDMLNAKTKLELGSTATPWMPSASEVTADDWPKFVGFSNTVKTNKSASDYVWFPDLTNKVEDHINNRSNPHGVTASQVGSYTKSEVATLISEAIKQSKLDANPIGTILTTISNTNPSTYIGGTWERFANGRTLVGVDENDSVTLMNTANNIGGLVNPNTKHAHNFAKVGSQQSYTYAWGTGTYATSQVYLNTCQIAAGAAPNNNLLTRQSSDLSMTVEVGDNTNHNNWQPFMTVYFWRRTA